MKLLKPILFLILSLGANQSIASPNQLTISIIKGDALNPISRKILTEAYQRIGIELTYVAFPAGRSIKMSNAGKVDGELHRIAGVDKKFVNLIQIPEMIQEVLYAAFSKDPSLKIKIWQDLSSYRLAVRRGIIDVKQLTEGMDVTFGHSDLALFKMLNNSRVDIVVATTTSGLMALKSIDLKNITPAQSLLKGSPLFHYLNIKHQELVPKINQALVSMTREGRIEQIKREYIEELKSL